MEVDFEKARINFFKAVYGKQARLRNSFLDDIRVDIKRFGKLILREAGFEAGFDLEVDFYLAGKHCKEILPSGAGLDLVGKKLEGKSFVLTAEGVGEVKDIFVKFWLDELLNIFETNLVMVFERNELVNLVRHLPEVGADILNEELNGLRVNFTAAGFGLFFDPIVELDAGEGWKIFREFLLGEQFK